MKKYVPSLLVAILLLGYAVPAHATVVSWDAASSILQPLQALWTYTIKGNNFTATSSTATNTFPHASTTQLTVSNTQWLTALGTPAGTILAVDPNGKIIATTTSAGGVTSVTGTYPVVSTGGNTPALSLAFGTTTSNLWAGTQTFTNAPIFSALTGVLKGNGASALAVAANGTDYTLITANTCGAGQFFNSITATGGTGCATPSGGGSGTVGTSTNETAGSLAYWTSNSATPALLGKIATTSATINNGLAGLLTTLGGSQTIGLATINAGVLGSPVNGAVPTSQATSTLYGLGTNGFTLAEVGGIPTWVATTTFSAPFVFSAGNVTCTNASAGVTGCLTGTDWSTFNNKQATIAVTAPLRLTGATIDYTGLSTTSQPASSNILVSNGAAGVFGVATSSETCTSASGVTCTTHTVVGTGGGAIALSAIPNASLANSTISGVALGGTLAALTATNGTLTFSGSYTGTAAQTVGLNLGNGNTWTALQQFSNASSTLFSATFAQIGGTATTTFLANGNVGIGTSSPYANLSINAPAQTGPYFVIGSSTSEVLSVAPSPLPKISIGSTTPWAQFSINPNVIGTGPIFAIGSSTGTLFVVNNAGLVGIGTTTPTNPLTLSAGTVTVPSVSFGDTATGFFRSVKNAIGFAINGVEQMTLTATGLGIGSTTPTANVSIGGAAGIWSFLVGSSTATTFGINDYGQIQSKATQPATTTALVLDWAKTGPQVEYQIGTSATTITLINATTSQWWGSRKVVWVCNPNAAAGAITWAGTEWVGTAPSQTTTANQCDIYSFDVTRATSTSAYKVAGTGGTGFQ